MQGLEDHDALAPRVTVESDDGSVEGVQRAADAAAAAARALAAAGYDARHLSVTSSQSGELVLIARLDPHVRSRVAPRAEPVEVEEVAAPSSRKPMLVRLGVGLTAGVLLGFLGLPRLEVPSVNLPLARSDPAPTALIVQNVAAPTSVPPTPTLAVATPTPTPAAVFDAALSQPISGWPNDPHATAWFAQNEYHLFARNAGSFVATGIPLPRPVRDVRISAQFHKVSGPSGGGYGIIVRDQSAASERDGRNQSGAYLVAEVGDQGDIGIWQRAQTHWIDIVPWQHSAAVHPGRAPNALTLTQHGATLQFLVNGQNVAEIEYTGIPDSGGIGLFAGGDLNEVALESLRIDTAD